jgi:hypothetical protein
MEWQPIKSAPSGERVLACDRRGTVFVAKLLVLRWYDDAERLIDRPEWWMPLPAAPSEEQPAAPKSRGRKPSR